MDAWLERRLEELSGSRADVARLVDTIERQATDFNTDLAGRLELDFVRRSPHSFSVQPTRERTIVLTGDRDPDGERLVLTTTRADGATEQFTLDDAEHGEAAAGPGEVNVRRMPNGNLELCLWLTLGTVLWPYCFYRYD